MMYTLSKTNRDIKGTITLDGSKSISNRVLMIRALCQEKFDIKGLSTSNDTLALKRLLSEIDKGEPLDAGAAGTTFRFMTAYLSLQAGTQVLTGSERMKQRPIGVLVDALKQLGARIEYIEAEAYPPLKIHKPEDFGSNNELSIAANVSSQYISALLMIAPSLPNGLALHLEGTIVSRPYIEMTLKLMEYFGVQHLWEGNTIKIKAQAYQARDFVVEADWSAASYYYAIAAFSENLALKLIGLQADSLQGDAVIAKIMEGLGIKTVYEEGAIILSKNKKELPPMWEWNFIKCPDIAQTLAVICGGLGVQALFSGLETLKIKETDRIQALQNELAKMQVFFSPLPSRFSKQKEQQYYMQEGKAVMNNPTFPTYEDHRMAMAFAPLAMLGTIHIEEPMVVRKSYPNFWKDLESLEFEVLSA